MHKIKNFNNKNLVIQCCKDSKTVFFFIEIQLRVHELHDLHIYINMNYSQESDSAVPGEANLNVGVLHGILLWVFLPAAAPAPPLAERGGEVGGHTKVM